MRTKAGNCVVQDNALCGGVCKLANTTASGPDRRPVTPPPHDRNKQPGLGELSRFHRNKAPSTIPVVVSSLAL